MVLMASAAALMYLVARALPRIVDSREVEPIGQSHWILHYIEKIDDWAKEVAEKTLRKLKVNILKLDNSVSKKLKNLKKESPVSQEENGSNHFSGEK